MSEWPMRRAVLALGALGAFWGAAPYAFAEAGDWILDTRLRYEAVSQDGLRDGDALTLRARFGYESAAWRGFNALIEAEGVTRLAGDFNDTVNGRAGFPIIADPDAFELNRAQIAWSGEAGRRAVLGRQRIILNNARFVGNVGFRQNEQTFDALRLEAKPTDQFGLTYIYIDRVRRVFGDDHPQGEWRSDSHVLQADVTLPFGRLSGYALLLDFENAPVQSSQTYGARWSHEWEVDGWRPRVVLEAAQQQDYRGNTPGFDLGYQHGELALRRDRWTLMLGGERLEGNSARGFATPLATLHAFQGWADVFLNTPGDGLRDLYAGVSYATRPWPADQPVRFSLVAHDFSDDGGGADFGREVDASVRIALNARASIEAKAALYDGEAPRFADREKGWLSFEYRL